jgi:hypothetical protein
MFTLVPELEKYNELVRKFDTGVQILFKCHLYTPQDADEACQLGMGPTASDHTCVVTALFAKKSLDFK